MGAPRSSREASGAKGLVRPMREADVSEVGSIFRHAFNEVYLRRGYGPVVADDSVGAVIARSYAELDPEHCLVVERDGRVIGSGFLHVRGETAGAGPITIAPRAQGTGAGRALMEEICRRADLAGVRSLRLIQDAFNECSFALYARMGFAAREVLARASFRSRPIAHPPGRWRPARPADLDALVALESRLVGLRRRRDHELLIRIGDVFLAEEGGEPVAFLARLVRGGVAVLGPGAAPSLDLLRGLIAFATRDLPPATDTRLLVPASRVDLLAALEAERLEVHSLCTYMVRGSFEPFRVYYVPTLFPESG